MLAQNSEPSPILFDNTGVGVISSKILATKGRITAVEREDRLQFAWGVTDDDPTLRKRLIVDRCYG